MDGERPQFGPDDDGFHFDALTDRWWETETAWFSFHEPQRRLGGWLYTMVRPNIGTVAGGVWVWDDGAAYPWDALYSVNYSSLPLPAGLDLRHADLPTGVRIRAVEPTRTYDLGYDDGELLHLALRFEGVMAPEPLTAAGSTFGSAHHFDQLGRVTGDVVVHGEAIRIDCVAMRDRTWGPRPETRPRQAAYVTAAVGPDDGFLAVTNTTPDGDPVSYGFLRRDGRTVSLAGGERLVTRDPHHGWITAITVTATDAEGRTMRAVGTPASRLIVNRHTFIDINSLVQWDLDGQVAWGEDQDMWPIPTMSAYLRERRGGSPPGGVRR